MLGFSHPIGIKLGKTFDLVEPLTALLNKLIPTSAGECDEPAVEQDPSPCGLPSMHDHGDWKSQFTMRGQSAFSGSEMLNWKRRS